MQSPDSSRPSSTRTSINVERRFPLDLRQSDQAIRALYEDAKRGHWVPATDIPWAAFDATARDAATLEAARRVWSRRAWIEYTGLAETPALVIRFCLELDREADPKYFLTVRNTEEAWHVESFYRYAEACGGYLDTPANPQWQPLFNRGLHRDALDARRSLDGHVLTHCTFGDGLEHVLAAAWLGNTSEPVARALLERCAADRERHARFGWLYIERRAATMSDDERAAASEALVSHLEQVELAGVRCVGLATGIDASADVAELDRVASAGLGAVTAQAEVALFTQYLAHCRERLGAIGIELPLVAHPTLGRI
ncbi:MAG: hypothetical protein EOP82_21980 [Variovorax sp.]|nr:MAG: hypothetical protein EOP82_21980 [Variovorax sp.]